MRVSRGVLLAIVLVVAVGAAVALLPGGGVEADGSVLSKGANGWLATRRYLEAKGTRVDLLDTPIADSPLKNGMLVLVFPWQRDASDESFLALDRFLRSGGTVLIAYSGSSATEDPLLGSLGLRSWEPRGRPPLNPVRWWRFSTEEWRLLGTSGDGAHLSMAAADRMPRPPAGARILYRTEGGIEVAFSFPLGRGTVVVVPAASLSNGRIQDADNLTLLESLRTLSPVWRFDEFHHGLQSVTVPSGVRTRRAFDVFLLHLLFLYVLGVLAVVRRFGPSWTESPLLSGSAASFLLGLAALHRRLDHHPRAARLLVERVLELDPRARPPRGESAWDDSSFLDLAQRVARAQAHTGRQR